MINVLFVGFSPKLMMYTSENGGEVHRSVCPLQGVRPCCSSKSCGCLDFDCTERFSVSCCRPVGDPNFSGHAAPSAAPSGRPARPARPVRPIRSVRPSSRSPRLSGLLCPPRLLVPSIPFVPLVPSAPPARPVRPSSAFAAGFRCRGGLSIGGFRRRKAADANFAVISLFADSK